MPRLLVQCTGGGKSNVAQTTGCCNCDVTLIIVETIARAADQQARIILANGVYGPVLVCQLYYIKRKNLVDKLKFKLEGLDNDGIAIVFIHKTPEWHLREPSKTN